jgi:hypothetical protein
MASPIPVQMKLRTIINISIAAPKSRSIIIPHTRTEKGVFSQILPYNLPPASVWKKGRRARVFQSAQLLVSSPGMRDHAALYCWFRLCRDSPWPGIRCDYQDPDAHGYVGQDYGGGEE